MSEDKPAYLEDWSDVRATFGIEVTPERAGLIAAAPALVRALLRVEWDSSDGTCPTCGGRMWEDSEHLRHASHCALHLALTKAGFPDRLSRESARKAILEVGR